MVILVTYAITMNFTEKRRGGHKKGGMGNIWPNHYFTKKKIALQNHCFTEKKSKQKKKINSYKKISITLKIYHIKNTRVVCGIPKTLYSVLTHWFLVHSFSTLLITLVTNALVKGCVCYILASLFCMSKRQHLWNKEKCFYFTSKALFVLHIIKF